MHRLLPTAGLLFLRLTIWAIPVAAQEPPPNGRDPADIFRHFDANGDKRLSKDEFLMLAERNARLKANVDLMLRRLDANRDGFLTLEEYSQLVKMQSARPPMPPAPGQKATAKANGFVETPTAEQVTFFEKKIRPVLAEHCYSCHSAEDEKLKGGLLLDSRDGLRAGGDSGPIVVPGSPEKSLLIESLRHTDDGLKMPPKQKLPAALVADFEEWVKIGAPDPRGGKLSGGKTASERAIDIEKGRQFWAFQPPKKTAPQAVKDEAWAETGIDQFLLAALEAKGLKPVAEADPHTLVRRLYLDLTGLPPPPERIEAFVSDYQSSSRNPQSAVERVVDSLLATSHFGERWGRHWLDVARFAESSGKAVNYTYPHAWRYRDYVIASFNVDKPYDKFIREQIAGDLMPTADPKVKAERFVATGFLALGQRVLIERNRVQFEMDQADEQIDTMTQSFLGITAACARCHDHKYDPIPQTDYYALAGIFRSTETCYGTIRQFQARRPSELLELPKIGTPSALPKLTTAERADLVAQRDELQKQFDRLPESEDVRRLQLESRIIAVDARLNLSWRNQGSTNMVGDKQTRLNRPMAAKCSDGLWVIVVLSMCQLAGPTYGQSEQRLFPTTGKMQVEVLDTAGQPLPEAKLNVSVWTNDESFKANQDYVCDAAGVAEIALPKEVQIVRIWVSAKGHAGMFANIASQQDKELTIPEKFVFRLSPGSVMSGRVLDEAKQPIAGVKVKIDYAYQHFKPENFVVPSISDSQTTTDAEGRWRFETIVPGSDVKVRLNLTHPDYVSDKVRQIGGEIASKQGVSEWQMRDGSAVIVLQRGYTVSGKVSDSAGQAVANALVAWGDDAYARLGAQDTRTKPDGSFQLGAVPAGPTRLTVITDKGMPQTRKIEVDGALQSFEIQLQQGKRLKVRFIDSAGHPVPDVRVGITRWRGQQSMFFEGINNLFDAIAPMRSNSEGVFEWTWAPDDGVQYVFTKQGFAHAEVGLTASDDSEHVQTLHRLLDISGTVKDATTGQPIDKFLAIPVIHFSPDFPMVNRGDAKRQSGGNFRLRCDRTDIEHGLQIEAPGYLTWRTSQRYKMGDASPKLDIRLKPTVPQVGRVLDSAGQPVKGAAVYVATAYQQLDLSGLQDRGGDYHDNYHVTADAEGRFEIVGQMERYAVVVIAPQGFAQVERQTGELPGELHIQPWAKVTGELVEAGEPVKGCTVQLFPIRPRGDDGARVDIRFSAATAADGSFTFERVPPLPSQVQGLLHFSVDSPLMSSRHMPLDLSPGEERHVVLGGGGAQITGKLLVENQPAGFDYHFSISYLVAKRPGIEPPAAIAAAGFDWRKGWTEAWRNSSEGSTYLQTLHAWFVKPNPGGHFRISGVEPGEYELAVNLFGTTEGCLVHPLATRVIPLTVKPSDTSLDLGSLSIPSLTLPKVGDLAPDFEFTTLAGSAGRLSGLRGRYVLLDFWATWCGPCVTKLSEVERLRERFAHEKQLEVVGLNLDGDRSRVESFLQSTKLPWTHVPLGDWSTTTIPRQFAISGIPAYVLIDPSGHIMAQENSLEKIEAALSEK